MARYISLVRFTEKGATNLKQSPARAEAFRSAVEKTGVTIEAQLWTVGSFDGVLILNGEENKILRCLADLNALGNVRTETLQAFDDREFSKIVS